jgi:hypothetical protein
VVEARRVATFSDNLSSMKVGFPVVAPGFPNEINRSLMWRRDAPIFSMSSWSRPPYDLAPGLMVLVTLNASRPTCLQSR